MEGEKGEGQTLSRFLDWWRKENDGKVSSTKLSALYMNEISTSCL